MLSDQVDCSPLSGAPYAIADHADIDRSLVVFQGKGANAGRRIGAGVACQRVLIEWLSAAALRGSSRCLIEWDFVEFAVKEIDRVEAALFVVYVEIAQANLAHRVEGIGDNTARGFRVVGSEGKVVQVGTCGALGRLSRWHRWPRWLGLKRAML